MIDPADAEQYFALLTDLLAVIHGDGGHHAHQHGLEESCRQAHERIADLRRKLDTARERVRELQDCGQDGPCVLSPGCQRHFLEPTRTLLAEAEERGAKWAIDERGLHAKRDTRPMARELCERMRRSR